MSQSVRHRRSQRRRASAWWLRFRPLILPVLFAVFYLVGFAVLSQEDIWQRGNVPPPFPDRFLYALYLFVAESPEGLRTPRPFSYQLAAFLALMLTFGAALQLVSSAMTKGWHWVTLRLFYEGHTIICGLSQKGIHLARALARAGKQVILIEAKPDHSDLESVRAWGLRVQIGDATLERELWRAGIWKARRLVCLCDDDTNFEIQQVAERLERRWRRRPPWWAAFGPRRRWPQRYLHVADRHLYEGLQDHAFATARTDGEGAGKLRQSRDHFLNIANWGAAKLVDWQPAGYRPVPLFATDGSANFFIVVGAGALGQAFAVECARRWSVLPPRERGSRPSFLLVDRKAGLRKEELEFDAPHLAPYWELHSADAEIPHVAFDRGDFLPANAPEPRRILVCLHDERLAVLASLRLLRLVKSRGWTKTIIIVRVSEGRGPTAFNPRDRRNPFWSRQLQPFHLPKEVLTVDFARYAAPELIAIALHGAYCREIRKTFPDATPQDKPAIAPWETLAENYRESTRSQAASIQAALASLPDPRVIETRESADGSAEAALTNEELESLARREHDRWMDERLAAGWTPGSPRDNERKIHPNLVPWEDLDEPTRNIDREMVRNWPKALAAAGLVIRRKKNRPAEV